MQLNSNLNDIVQMQNVLQNWQTPIYPAILSNAPQMCGRIMSADERLKERTKELLNGPFKELKKEVQIARQFGMTNAKISKIVSEEITKLITGLK